MRLEGQREKKERKKKATPVPTKTSKDNTTVIDDVEVGGKPTLTMFLPSARQSPPPPRFITIPARRTLSTGSGQDKLLSGG